jgi:NMD protein affecting ribosome stability and mRNA decay
MAQCKNCGTKFGCGCQLTNGLCSACIAATKGVKRFKDVITKINRLCKLF